MMNQMDGCSGLLQNIQMASPPLVELYELMSYVTVMISWMHACPILLQVTLNYMLH